MDVASPSKILRVGIIAAVTDCLFCRIVAHESPADIEYEDDAVLAFKDIYPKAPVHVLIVPKRHITSVMAMESADAEALGRCLLAAKSLGEAKASIVPLSGDAGEMAVTVAWDLSWYQYRVSPDSGQPVRLERRGHELEELEDGFKEWNAHVEDEGRLVPEIARL